MDKTIKEKVYKLLKEIPYGKVVTYGDIAERLGNRKLARVVGNILHQNTDGIVFPCYKVVNSKGQLSKAYAFGGIDAQEERLRKEGIKVVEHVVDLKKYRFSYLK
ncbi:MAG: MGMT family protein [Erysipelotrichaceae bacterium]|nr:MGMT family protein [Erysipelotrichaceae bacterium]